MSTWRRGPLRSGPTPRGSDAGTPAPLRLDPGRRREPEVAPLPLAWWREAERRGRMAPQGRGGALGTANHRAQRPGQSEGSSAVLVK